MKNYLLRAAICLCVFAFMTGPQAEACTNLLVTRGASRDGSVMIT